MAGAARPATSAGAGPAEAPLAVAEGLPAAVAAAREIPGTPPRAVASPQELRQVPHARRWRFLQLRMAAQYRSQAWSVLGPLPQAPQGALHVKGGLQTVRKEGRVARVVRGRHEAHFLTCVP